MANVPSWDSFRIQVNISIPSLYLEYVLQELVHRAPLSVICLQAQQG